MPKTKKPSHIERVPVRGNALTLRQLHKRLGEIIAEHEARGWGVRNDQLVVMEVRQERTPKGRYRPSLYLPVLGACSGTVSIGDPLDDGNVNCTTLRMGRSTEDCKARMPHPENHGRTDLMDSDAERREQRKKRANND